MPNELLSNDQQGVRFDERSFKNKILIFTGRGVKESEVGKQTRYAEKIPKPHKILLQAVNLRLQLVAVVRRD